MYMAMSCMQVSSIMHMITCKCLHVARALQPLSSLRRGGVVQLGTLQFNQHKRKPPSRMCADAKLCTPFVDRC